MAKRKKQKVAARVRRKPNLPAKEELVIAKGLGVALLKENKELKSEKIRLEKERLQWIKNVTTLENSRITKDQMIEKQRTEISELKDAVRLSRAYIRMLLQEDITEHRINVVYNIEG